MHGETVKFSSCYSKRRK